MFAPAMVERRLREEGYTKDTPENLTTLRCMKIISNRSIQVACPAGYESIHCAKYIH
jgi:hypothetical protein